MVLFVAFLTALTLVCLSIVFGGTCALAFITAPALFKKFESRSAGDAFGLILRRFDRLGLGSAILAAGCCGILLTLVDHNPIRRELFTAVGAVSTMIALLFVYSSRLLTPRLAAAAPPREPEAQDLRTDEQRALFDRLHKRHVQVYSANLFLSLGALVLHALPI